MMLRGHKNEIKWYGYSLHFVEVREKSARMVLHHDPKYCFVCFSTNTAEMCGGDNYQVDTDNVVMCVCETKKYATLYVRTDFD